MDRHGGGEGRGVETRQRRVTGGVHIVCDELSFGHASEVAREAGFGLGNRIAKVDEAGLPFVRGAQVSPRRAIFPVRLHIVFGGAVTGFAGDAESMVGGALACDVAGATL